MEKQKSDSGDLASIARQPIFDEKARLWGYEIFCVGNTEIACPNLPDQPNAAIHLESSAYLSLQQISKGGKKIVVDFSEKSVLDKIPYALPPVLAVIKVCEQAAQRPSVMEALQLLKDDGFLIALRDFTGNPECERLYRISDIVAIDTRTKDKDSITKDLARARKYSAMPLASHVPDRRLYELCRELEFSLFHGPFFKLPDKMIVRKLTSNEVLRLKILQFIEGDDPDPTRLAEMIRSDATISVRLLAYLNSAAFAFSRSIRSIHQAIALLGWVNVKNWLRVLLLTDMSQGKDARELVLLSAQRGMLLEVIAKHHDFWGFDPETLHLLGLFSLLDALLDLPMTQIVTSLPIDNKTKAALCREPNNEYLPLLQLAQCLEEARWPECERMIQQLNLDREKVMTAFHDSVKWATQLDSVHSGNGSDKAITGAD
jgi:c-di-GMP phosphodiesterase